MIILGVAAIVVLVAANACFAAFEYSLVSVDRDDVDRRAGEGTRGARAARSVIARRPTSISGAQLGITLCSIAMGVVAEPVIADALRPVFGDAGGAGSVLSVTLALVAAVAIQVVVGELVPKSVAVDRPDRVAVALAGPFAVFVAVAGPVIRLGNRCSEWVLAVLRVDRSGSFSDVRSREELRGIVRRSEQSGSITRSDAALLDRTFRFAEKTAADALTPRVAVRSLPLDSSVGDLMELSATTGLSRFPVHQEDLDDIVGVVHIKDVLGIEPDRRSDEPLSSLLREVVAVPESKDLESLMVQLQDEAGQFALVVDEYGGTAGIITLEDLVEEIVGDIDDEHDPAHATPTVRRWGGAHVVSGRLHPDELHEACGLDLPDGDFETLGGFVMDRLGSVPSTGDHFDHEGWRVEVAEMDGHRVSSVRLVAPLPGLIDLPKDEGDAREGGPG